MLVAIALGTITALSAMIATASALRDHADAREAASTAAVAAAPSFGAGGLERPVFRYSVVPGGVYAPRELQRRATWDDVVRGHYADVTLETLRVETVPAPITAYVSYRRGDQIFWTRRPVRIEAGELILTNGVAAVRARCGNRISFEPLLPVAEDEPALVELDALVDAPEPSALAPGATPGVRVLPASVPKLSRSFDTPADGVSVPRGGGDGSPGAPRPDHHDSIFPIPIGRVEPREDDGGSGVVVPIPDDGDLPSDEPGPKEDGVERETDDDDVDDDRVPPSDDHTPLIPIDVHPQEPVRPVSVPEPGTIALVGSGVAAWLLRKRRARP
jgi:hypothetical protein